MIRIEITASVPRVSDQVAAAVTALAAMGEAAKAAGLVLHSLHLEDEDA